MPMLGGFGAFQAFDLAHRPVGSNDAVFGADVGHGRCDLAAFPHDVGEILGVDPGGEQLLVRAGRIRFEAEDAVELRAPLGHPAAGSHCQLPMYAICCASCSWSFLCANCAPLSSRRRTSTSLPVPSWYRKNASRSIAASMAAAAVTIQVTARCALHRMPCELGEAVEVESELPNASLCGCAVSGYEDLGLGLVGVVVNDYLRRPRCFADGVHPPIALLSHLPRAPTSLSVPSRATVRPMLMMPCTADAGVSFRRVRPYSLRVDKATEPTKRVDKQQVRHPRTTAPADPLSPASFRRESPSRRRRKVRSRR
jgi:hypothetical protein